MGVTWVSFEAFRVLHQGLKALDPDLSQAIGVSISYLPCQVEFLSHVLLSCMLAAMPLGVVMHSVALQHCDVIRHAWSATITSKVSSLMICPRMQVLEAVLMLLASRCACAHYNVCASPHPLGSLWLEMHSCHVPRPCCCKWRCCQVSDLSPMQPVACNNL